MQGPYLSCELNHPIMRASLIVSLLVAVAISMVTSRIIYFGFTPNYAADIFSPKAFNGRFDHDVYKYRVLCKYLLFAIDDWLGNSEPAGTAETRILINTRDGSERFYYAFYYLNTFFLALTTIMVVLLVRSREDYHFTKMEQNLLIFFVPVFIGLSEYVVCVYDVSSYFFQLLTIYILLKFYREEPVFSMVTLGILIVVSTLNRESSALSVSMLAVLLLSRYGFKRRILWSVLILAVCFLLTYVGLRFWIVDPYHVHIRNHDVGKYLKTINLYGLLFWVIFFYLPMAIADSKENRFLIGAFFLFGAPYVYTCLKDGVLWEVRLYIPLFLGAFFLGKLDTSRHIVRISELQLRWPRRKLQVKEFV